MSGIVRSAHEAFRRWRSDHPDTDAPVVRVHLTDGSSYYFNGLAVPQNMEDESVVSILSAGSSLPVFVVRDSDVARVEIGDVDEPPFGFTQEARD